MSVIRVIVPDEKQDQASIIQAFRYVKEICEKKAGLIQEIVLFIPTKTQVRHTDLANALGDKVSRTLENGGSVELISGIPMKLETIKTLRWFARPTVVLCAYADQKMLDQVDGLSNVEGVVALPFVPDALSGWAATWNPLLHGKEQVAPRALVADPLFEQALLSITRSVNLSHSVLSATDKNYADKVLRILRVKGHSADLDNVRAWVIQHGWRPSAADEFVKLAARVADLKTKPRVDAEEVARLYKYWQECLKVASKNK